MLLSASCAKLVVVPVTAPLTDEGVFYALPKTAARVQLKIDRKASTAAPFGRFAAIFAPGGKPVSADGTSYAVQEGATISTFGEPDPKEIYLVRFAGGGAMDQALSMTWNEAGLLSQAGGSVTNRTTDIVVAGLKLVAGFSARGGFGDGTPGAAPVALPCPTPSGSDAWVLRVLEEETANQGQVRLFLVKNYCDIEVKNGVRIPQFGTEDEMKAQLRRATRAYLVQVLPFVNARTKLLEGNGIPLEPVPLINKLDLVIEEELKILYLGSTVTTTWDGALDVRDLKVGQDLPLLRIDSGKGVCPLDPALVAPTTKPLPPDFQGVTAAECLNATPVSLRLEYHPAEADQLFKAVKDRVTAPTGERGFRYRIPGQVRAHLGDSKGQSFGGGVFSVAQLGPVVSLPARRNSKSISYDLAFIEATGGLKSFKLGTTGGLDAATVDALAAAGNTVLDARNAERKAAATAADELTILTREHALLKLKDEICQIQKKNGLECTVEP
jgi:hypothetical protein